MLDGKRMGVENIYVLAMLKFNQEYAPDSLTESDMKTLERLERKKKLNSENSENSENS